MELVPYFESDLPLTEALECDPIVMKELGGPHSRERIAQVHQMRLKKVAEGNTWWFKIVPDPASGPAGTIGIWESEWNGAKINETGWLILPAFQGRGLASAAAKMILAKARTEKRFPIIHAFPGVLNGPSNSICRKCGFTQLEECDIDYAGRTLRCNHWRIDLSR